MTQEEYIGKYKFALSANKSWLGQKDPKFELRRVALKALADVEKLEKTR